MLFGRACMILELHDKGQALRDRLCEVYRESNA